MLAAISTTILSNRSWALTCSAMVSRSRLSRTRGPPDALRMLSDPLHHGQSGAWPATGVQAQKDYNFIHPAPSLLASGPNQVRQKPWHSLWLIFQQAYSELRLVLPSKRPARGNAAPQQP